MRRRTLGLTVVVALALTSTAWAAPPKFRGNPDDAFKELDKQFTLRFYNAVTGKPIANARVRFEGRKARTDREGAVRFVFPKKLAPEDTRHAYFSRRGYVSAKVPVRFQVGTLFFNRYSVSPAIPIGYLRIVLDWGKAPLDLDTHLVKKGSYHISFRKTRNYRERAWLDRDDRNGYGPETITIKRVNRRGVYHFFVHDWSNRSTPESDRLSASRAHVRVYTRKGLKHSWSVPAGKSGTFWKVFTLRKGRIEPVAKVSTGL